MKSNLLFGGNAVLMRELRASLRSARPFALLSIYVAILGAITVAQFPAGQQISIERTPTGENAGKQLYWTFVSMQALLIVLVLPALASGALSQEREQRTLEPLLLTPLTPLQIVWGKAVGVLSLAGLLLLSTLPLTSLCFLLGGVSPGELIAAYSILLGLALFTTSIGIYCSAKWANTTKATLIAYAILPVFLAFILLFSGVGIILAAFTLFGVVIFAFIRLWREWGQRPVGERTLAHRMGALWNLALWAGLPIVVVVMVYFLLADHDAGSVAFGIFGVAYLLFIAQNGLQLAAQEIVRLPEPGPSSRQKMQELQAEWSRVVAVSSPETPTAYYSAPPRSTPASHPGSTPASTPATPFAEPLLSVSPTPRPLPADGPTRISHAAVTSRPAPPPKPTYGVEPFLSDRLNPVYAKDMRTGLLGKFVYLVRFSYLAVIGSELLLLFLAFVLPAQSVTQEWSFFTSWAKVHLVALILAGAWLGARSIAPEHEQQTLEQLLLTPLSTAQIVWGKIAAVMTYTAYIFMLGMPMAILLAALRITTWRGALSFLAIEHVFGVLAAAWGIFCSLKMVTTRRALGMALGGVFCLIVSSLLLSSLILPGLRILLGTDLISASTAQFIGALLSPLQLLGVALSPPSMIAAGSTPAWMNAALLVSLLLYSALAAALLALTTRGFARYADKI